MWSDGPSREQVQLGENLQQVDLWGTRRTPRAIADEGLTRQEIDVDDLPTFLVGVDPHLARWSIAVEIETAELAGVFGQAQTAVCRFTNTFPRGVGGTVTLKTPDVWEVEPRRVPFKLAAGETRRQTFQILLGANASSGRQAVRLDFEVTSDRVHRFSVYREIRVGLRDLDVELSSRLDEKGNLLVEQRLTNESDRLVSFNCLLSVPQRRRERQQVFRLGRGSVTNLFVLPHGEELLGQTLWLRTRKSEATASSTSSSSPASDRKGADQAMPSVRDVGQFLEEFAPCRLAEDWDNVGLLVGDPERVVRRLMTCLTITPASAEEAIDARVDLIVSHHPLPFHALKRLTTETLPGRLLLRLIAAEIGIHSPHTAFDSAAAGINQRLAESLGLVEIRPLVRDGEDPQGLGAGRWGRFPEPEALGSLAARLKQRLSVPLLQLVGSLARPVAVGCRGVRQRRAVSARRASRRLRPAGRGRDEFPYLCRGGGQRRGVAHAGTLCQRTICRGIPGRGAGSAVSRDRGVGESDRVGPAPLGVSRLRGAGARFPEPRRAWRRSARSCRTGPS